MTHDHPHPTERPLGPWEQVMGHTLAIPLREDGDLAGGADPRGDGYAAA